MTLTRASTLPYIHQLRQNSVLTPYTIASHFAISPSASALRRVNNSTSFNRWGQRAKHTSTSDPISSSRTQNDPFVVRFDQVPSYSPAHHTGTINRRLICPATVDSESIEVLHGTLTLSGPGQARATPHLHPDIDQVCYLLSGRAIARILIPEEEDGKMKGNGVWREQIMEKGDACFFKKGVVHEFVALSRDKSQEDGGGGQGVETVELLVVYSPPYLEMPETKTVIYRG